MPESALTGVLTTFDAAGQPGLVNMIGAFVIFFGIFYVVAILPQNREKKAHEELLASLAKDDQVVTQSGIHGRIVEVQPELVVIEIAEKTRIKVDRSAIARKGSEPAPKK